MAVQLPTNLGYRYLPQNETGRLTIVGDSEPVIIFDQRFLPYTAARSGGESIYQQFPRYGKAPRKLYTGRRLYRFTLAGTYSAEHWAGISPLSLARAAQDRGASFLLKVNQGRNAPSVNLQGLTPAPFDPLPIPSPGEPLRDSIQVTINSIAETPHKDKYFFNTPILTDWVIQLEEDAE